MTAEQDAKLYEATKALSESDYKLIKCLEALLLNLPMPYNVQALVNERNDLRKIINDIQAEAAE